jgi:sigma-B regulation protein RsbQ
MNIQLRNNVKVVGDGPATIVFAHGFGCDSTMWRDFSPIFSDRYRIVLFDLVGSGQSDLAAYDPNKYATLHGYADDLLEIVREFGAGPVISIGHSVSATISMLAAIRRPELFAANVMVGPSASFIDDGDYVGGFSRTDIEELLQAMDGNYLGWSSAMAPSIMGAPDRPELAEDLTNSFCRTDPTIAKHFARVTFLADHRLDLAAVTTPTLLIQSDDDLLAPLTTGEYMHRHIAGSVLRVINNVGHCPHLSAVPESQAVTQAFLHTLGL